jgi:hypothetical protein
VKASTGIHVGGLEVIARVNSKVIDERAPVAVKMSA